MGPKRSRSSSPLPPFISTCSQQHDFATHGWLCVPTVLSLSELCALRSDCSALCARESADSIAANGCVVDVMSQYPMHDSDPARIDSKCYLQARADQLKSTGADVEIIASLLFRKLPAIVEEILLASLDTKDKKRSPVFFFNEHFVVKPPKSHVEFRWHRDDDEQLAMCVHRKEIPLYVSAWCALDDVTKANGALRFVSLDAPGQQEAGTERYLEKQASEPVIATAGDVIFFMSNVWHCSSSNKSDGARRAFYAQYSRERITARPNDSAPLSFAIPCDASTFDDNEMSTFTCRAQSTQ